ncbi:MAG TPA: FdtA/QdtA family cupin domain-containing protein [Blastocatellia bacterium]|jgi:dTDP-4-dehydrorhamnose 3,5-epimerase-like enzyme|nr:FdtA/QdtA family cupin domain-containing protein [Blastocatellia bacterium]
MPEPMNVSAVRVYQLPVVKDSRGSLSYAQYGELLPFIPRRYFIVFDVPEGQVRGRHAHREVEQFLVCVRGRVSVVVDDGGGRDEILLDGPSLGLYIPPRIWATQQNHSPDAALLVLSSDVYDSDEYIRDYDEFLGIVKQR